MNAYSIVTLRAALGAGLVLAVLTGCSNIKETLGLNKKPPDEFAVVSRAPLSVPPDAALRPPRPGSARPQETQPREGARQTVFGLEETRQQLRTTDTSPGEAAILNRAGASEADTNIRRIIDQDMNNRIAENESFTNKILFWKDRSQPPASTVDAAGEAERLRRNSAIGLPPEEGQTPVETQSAFESLF